MDKKEKGTKVRVKGKMVMSTDEGRKVEIEDKELLVIERQKPKEKK